MTGDGKQMSKSVAAARQMPPVVSSADTRRDGCAGRCPRDRDRDDHALPAFLLDFLISADIMLSVVVLMVSMYITKPVEFSTFPTTLLLLTLFRLALNISSSRLILLNGNSGTSRCRTRDRGLRQLRRRAATTSSV